MEPLTTASLEPAIHAALRSWFDLTDTSNSLLEALLLVQQERARAGGVGPSTRRRATNEVLASAIETLGQQDVLGAQVLTMRFQDQLLGKEVANALNLSVDRVKREQQRAIGQLTQIIWEREQALQKEKQAQLLAALSPASYSQLFGIEEAGATLARLLRAPDAPWVVALVGIGGIGKTSLADAVVRQLIPVQRFQQLLWITVDPDQSEVPGHDPATTLDRTLRKLASALCPDTPRPANAAQVRQVLKSAPHLIVIDNLESDSESAFLPDALNDLANPSKFLLTTRARLPISATVHPLNLEELPLAAVAELVRHQARYVNLPALAAASTDEIERIYQATGGNPLAIKIVVGLAAVFPLPHILEDLAAARITEVERMYQHIYRKAWESLSEPARALLKMMPVASATGVTPEQMQVLSELEPARLWPAISELVTRSLLETRGTAWERRYGIHRLTDSFLKVEIIRWRDE